MRTRAPASASASATAAPIPVPPPVTRATSPANDEFSIGISFVGRATLRAVSGYASRFGASPPGLRKIARFLRPPRPPCSPLSLPCPFLRRMAARPAVPLCFRAMGASSIAALRRGGQPGDELRARVAALAQQLDAERTHAVLLDPLLCLYRFTEPSTYWK